MLLTRTPSQKGSWVGRHACHQTSINEEHTLLSSMSTTLKDEWVGQADAKHMRSSIVNVIKSDKGNKLLFSTQGAGLNGSWVGQSYHCMRLKAITTNIKENARCSQGLPFPMSRQTTLRSKTHPFGSSTMAWNNRSSPKPSLRASCRGCTGSLKKQNIFGKSKKL